MDQESKRNTAMDHHHGRIPMLTVCRLICGLALLLACLLYYYSSEPIKTFSANPLQATEESNLESVLRNASMEDKKTVIITTLNEAWAAPGMVFDVFLESFRTGNRTEELLDHLVVVAMDEKGYSRCLALHPHCYAHIEKNKTDLSKDAYYMTPKYFDMMWRRTEFLYIVVKLGYSFVFTDADITWFRSPFPQLYPDAEFQIACDNYGGDPLDMKNWPNGGFYYVKSSNITIQFYKFWLESRKTYPGMNEQDVLNNIKGGPELTKMGLTFKFLDTKFFGGFCQPSRDFNSVCTMHANCCFGLDNKVNDMKILLDDWRKYLLLPSEPRGWSAPQKCSLEYHPPVTPEEKAEKLGKGGEN